MVFSDLSFPLSPRHQVASVGVQLFLLGLCNVGFDAPGLCGASRSEKSKIPKNKMVSAAGAIGCVGNTQRHHMRRSRPSDPHSSNPFAVPVPVTPSWSFTGHRHPKPVHERPYVVTCGSHDVLTDQRAPQLGHTAAGDLEHRLSPPCMAKCFCSPGGPRCLRPSFSPSPTLLCPERPVLMDPSSLGRCAACSYVQQPKIWRRPGGLAGAENGI